MAKSKMKSMAPIKLCDSDAVGYVYKACLCVEGDCHKGIWQNGRG